MQIPKQAGLGTITHLILDMDGVLWRGNTPMPGLADFFATLETVGVGYVLATNNATRSISAYVKKLASFGVQVPAEQILTSGLATAVYLRGLFDAGTRVYVVGEPALRDFMSAEGFEVLDSELELTQALEQPAALVVAGLHKQVTYHELALATLHINRGAAFYGTNPDNQLPDELGLLPGAGAILAALEAATGVAPTVVGKPGPIMFEEALRRLNAGKTETAMVGDRFSTDIVGGQNAGLRTILLMSGVTGASETIGEPGPDYVFDDIAALGAALDGRATA
jgi:4-nitrophenyl phosphatase